MTRDVPDVVAEYEAQAPTHERASGHESANANVPGLHHAIHALENEGESANENVCPYRSASASAAVTDFPKPGCTAYKHANAIADLAPHLGSTTETGSMTAARVFAHPPRARDARGTAGVSPRQ